MSVRLRHPPRTLEEFLDLPERKPALEFNPDGSITRKVAPNFAHSALQIHIGSLLLNYVRAHLEGCGHVLSELRVVTNGSSRLPDVAFYRERPPLDHREYALVPPDLGIEIRSPSQTVKSQRERCRWWVEQGSRVMLLVIPETRTIEYFDADGRWQIYSSADVIPLEPVLAPYGPGVFTLCADDVFSVLNRR